MRIASCGLPDERLAIVDLRDYLHLLHRQWRLIAACVLLSAGAAALVSVTATPQYRSTVKFFVSTPTDTANSAYTGGLFSQQRAKSYADILAGPATADAVAAGVPGSQTSSLQGVISAAVVPDTVLLEATITDPSAERALQIARAVAATFPRLVTDLEKPSDVAEAPVKVSVVEEPRLPGRPFTPQPVRNLGLAVVLGLLLGVGLAVLRETLDNTVKTQEDVRLVTGHATLGTVAFDADASKRPLIVQDSPHSARAESFRQLRTNLQFVQVDGALRSFVVTSSLPHEGKSTTACNLALTLAQAGLRVCLVEADLRRPKIADYLGIEGAVGVTSVLIGLVGLDDALQPWGDGVLEVLPSGPIPPNPSELLSSTGMATLLRSLEQRFELVIVDAPPLLPVTDGAILSTLTGGAVLCVHAGATRRDQLGHAVAALEAVDAKVLGMVLNMVPATRSSASSPYRYVYGSYTSDVSRPQLSAEESMRGLQTVRHSASSVVVGPPGSERLGVAQEG